MLEEGQSEWEEREGNGGTRKKAERERKEERAIEGGGGGETRGSLCIDVGIVGEREKGKQGQELQKQHKEKREGHGR